MGNQLTLGDKVHIFKQRVTEKLRKTLIKDDPPSLEFKRTGGPTLKEMKKLAERYDLASLLPYEAYEAERGLYYNRDTVGWMLYANPASGINPSELKTLNGFFNQNHRSDTTLQVSIIADPNVDPILRGWQQAKAGVEDPFIDSLTTGRVEYLKQGKWESLFSDQAFLIRNYHLVISYTTPITKGLEHGEIPKEELDALVRLRDAAMGTLRSARIYSESMKPQVFINLMNGLMNPCKAEQPKLYYDDNNLISEQMVDSDTVALFESGAASLIHQGEAYSLLNYNVRQYPERWAGYKNSNLIGSFTNNILRIPCPFIATLTVNVPDQVSAKGKVMAKSIRATQMTDSPMGKFVPQWKERKVDWDFVAKKMDNGNRLMEGFYQIVLLAPEGREEACEQAIKSVYGSLGWVLSKTRYTPIHALLGALPMGLCQEVKKSLRIFKHFDTRLSWTCTNIAPWVGEWKGTQTPMMLLTSRRGQLAYFDPFDNDKGNYNISCSATSGSGKSFFTQEWIFSCLGSGGRAFVIDAGHSYRNQCQLLGGTYLEFGNADLEIKLNPFSSIDESDPKFFKEQLPLLKMLIAEMAGSERPLSGKQRAILEKAIMRAWERYGAKATISRVVEALMKDTTDDGPLHATAKDLAVMLHSYTKEGMYGDYFEGESNIDLDNRMVVLELDALNNTPDLQSVVLLVLMMRITQVMYLSGNKAQRKLCIIDEAWRLLGRGRAGEFIEEGYRVARKHGGSFMTITQKISDYYKSDTAKAAYANSDFKIYLRQDEGELAEAEANGHISNVAGKVDVIRSLETIQGKYSELAIDSPSGLSVMRFTVDPVTEKLYSTKANEVQYLREAQNAGRDVFEAIYDLIRQSGGR